MAKIPLEKIHSNMAPNRLNVRTLAPRPDVHKRGIGSIINRLGATDIAINFRREVAFNVGHDKIASDAIAALPAVTTSTYKLIPDEPLIVRGSTSLRYAEIVEIGGDFYAKYNKSDKWSYEQVADEEKRFGNRMSVYEIATLTDDTESGLRDTKNLMEKLSNRRGDAEFGEKLESAMGNLEGAEIPLIGRLLDALDVSLDQAADVNPLDSPALARPSRTDGEAQGEKARALFSSSEFSDAARRYVLLLLTNWDHFHPWCLYRYRHLHDAAKAAAFEAGSVCKRTNATLSPNLLSLGSPGSNGLKDALAMNAFADHFLTDAFSAGHLIGNRRSERDKRVGPGKVLFTLPGGRVILRGELYAAKKCRDLHDKYSRDGLPVEDATGIKFPIRGDHFWGDYADDYARLPPWNGDMGLPIAQVESLVKAVVLSISDIYQSFLQGALGSGYRIVFKDANLRSLLPEEPGFPLGGRTVSINWFHADTGSAIDPLVLVPHLSQEYFQKRCCSRENALAQKYFPNISVEPNLGLRY